VSFFPRQISSLGTRPENRLQETWSHLAPSNFQKQLAVL
jgi:hypothetical protein